MMRRSQQMASYSEKILDDTVEGEKPLGLASRFEAAHLPFPLARRLLRGFGAIIGVTFRIVSRVAKSCSNRFIPRQRPLGFPKFKRIGSSSKCCIVTLAAELARFVLQY
jgi:hypothetical protein